MYQNQTIKTKLTIPAHNSFLEIALSFIANSSKILDFTEKELFQINLAVEEATSNIIQHALGNNVQNSFNIECHLKEDSIEILFHEKGKPFEPNKVHIYNPKEITLQSDAKGLGMFLIQELMDSVEYKNRGREGKETILRKYLSSKRIDKIIELLPPLEQKHSTDIEYELRPFQEEDAIGVSESAYSAYGYTYEPYIYYPSQIIEMNQKKTMRSFISQAKSGDIMGHIALKYSNNDNVAEIGVAFVKQEYRGSNIFNKMIDYTLHNAQTTPHLKCLYGRAVTAHPISQDALLRREFTPTAILLSLFPADVEFKNLNSNIVQKDGAILLCSNIKKIQEQREVYLPAQHKKIINTLFTSLDFRIKESQTDSKKKRHENTQIEYKIIDIFNCGEIYCTGYSKESVQQIYMTLQTLCINRVDAVYLYLDLEDSYLPQLVNECEKFGFFFSGILPFGIDKKHALILQYLNNLEFDFTQIQFSPTATSIKNIKNYILSCYNNSRRLENLLHGSS